MTSFVVVVYDPSATQLNRSPYNRNVNAYTPITVPAYNGHLGNPLTDYRGWYMVETQAAADLLAESLAKEFPGRCIKVSKVTTEYQSETPKVSKKTVSERGTLPA